MTYEDYLKTDHWKRVRQEVIDFWDGKCALCFSDEIINVHHRHYQHMWHETIHDCIALCHECHKRHERIMEEANDPRLAVFWAGVYSDLGMGVING